MNVNQFSSTTGISEENIYFCKERIEKESICRKLRITHFIDDRIHIMQILKNVVPYLFLFGDKNKNKGARKWTTLVADWDETHDMILTSIEDFKDKYKTG